MIELSDTKCCGVVQIDMLSHAKSPADAIAALKDGLVNRARPNYRPSPAPFVIFTGVVGVRHSEDHASLANDARRDDYGQDFADYIINHKLGTITQTEDQRNWTGNRLRVWIWTPDYEVLKEWKA